MRRWMFVMIVTIGLQGGGDLFAIQKLYTDNKGFRHFTCGENMRGAHIAIKDMGKDRFRVKSSVYGGILRLPKEEAENPWCTGLLGAVRVLCGYCEFPTSRGKVEDKRRQLGLHSAE